MSNKRKKVNLKADGRVWINTPNGKLVGKGRIELLEKIHEFGSIRQAAISMKMSYRQAWQLVDEMNEFAKTPLVISNRGCKGGGGGVVTEEGLQLITLFNSFAAKFQKFLSEETKKNSF